MQNKYKPKPKTYSKFAKKILKQLHIIKRKLENFISKKKYSKTRTTNELEFKVFEHKSLLLRKLKDVDMQLQINKITNLKLAIEKIDGIIIKPNETFSIWNLVGNPTAKRGFLEGLVLSNGKIGKGVGGGLCQLGNLLYWIILHTPLKITERWRHSYDVFPDVNRTLPFGSGATLSYNYVDFQFLNNTNYDYQIKLWISKDYLHGAIFCTQKNTEKYEIFEQNHQIVHQWWGGYTRHNELLRKIIIENEENIEFITENHAVMMYNPMLSE